MPCQIPKDTLLELAIPTHNLEKRIFYQSSFQSMPLNANCMSWNPSERQVSPPLSKDVSFKVELPPQLHHDAKHLGLRVQPDPGSCTTHSIGQSQGQCLSSESGEDETRGKGVEGTMKPAFLSNLDLMPHPPQVGYSNIVGQFHPYAEPYYGGFLTAYGPQAMPPMVGMAPPRVPLPLDLQEDGPIYVNAKQYHGILRRRQSRAKLEAQNKLLKARKPYLHESRHQHALNRVRGSGGRFLSKKELQQYDQNPTSGSNDHVSGSINLHQKDTPERESHHSGSSDLVTSVASHSGITSVSGTNAIFRQPDRRFSGGVPPHMSGAMQFSGGLMGSGNQHCASFVR
ncbi:putative transcription factor Hap2/NF-YA family [Rosa chinensis]|uniref:Nuclear transcription factor Y subunit n=2 Tax=Rosa chinensis TaxID=74649 RepID=A0A2P6RKI2_ROSCH|nr:nuclear transcription factor Y subunit A-3 isoform X1 [Rosa chinensis]PRQ46925.1 putative transcription factor Hap2/NF-YA family [Rosa chinensis]